MIHDGSYWSNDPVVNGTACHTVHHLYFNYNYGQFTTLGIDLVTLTEDQMIHCLLKMQRQKKKRRFGKNKLEKWKKLEEKLKVKLTIENMLNNDWYIFVLDH